MQHKNIVQLFEIEMWSYLDKTLEDKRMRFWETEIQSNPELQEMLQNQKDIIKIFNEDDTYELSDKRFQEMIEKATSKTNFLEKLKSIFRIDGNNFVPKLAFGMVLLIASISVLIISNNPNPINKLTDVALNWDEDSIDKRFANISSNISYLENDDLRRYYIYSRSKNEWDQEVLSITKKLDNLIKETNSQ